LFGGCFLKWISDSDEQKVKKIIKEALKEGLKEVDRELKEKELERRGVL
jgi:hypothetical protein